MAVLLSCSSQQNSNDNSSQQKKRIKVETVIGYAETEKGTEFPIDSITSKTVFKYDKNGKLVETIIYDTTTDSIILKTLRVYDEKGNRIEETSYRNRGEVEKSVYKHDDKNNEIYMERYSKGELRSKMTKTYDYQTMVVTEAWLDTDRKLENKWSYKIDEKGNHIEYYDAQANTESKASYVYNDKGNIIKITNKSWKNKDTIHNNVVNIQYDQYDNEIMKTMTELSNNNFVSNQKTEYVYDEFGNWTKMVETYSWLPFRQTKKREIEYYEK